MDTPGGIAYVLQHVGTNLQRQFDQLLLEQLGIGMSQFRILMALKSHPDLSQRRLAANLGQTEASISRQVRILQKKGLIITQVHPRSKRERVTNPTPRGSTVIDAAKDLFEQAALPLLKGLSQKQQKVLMELLNNVHQQACLPDSIRACDHQLDLWGQKVDHAPYVLAIS
jgi:DNA-binding MarR family transcriptional regulator